jgi:dienelactone hydrolase
MTNFTELFGRGFDEASFALITSMKRFQKSPQYVTDRQSLENLLTKAEATPQELFAAPPVPVVEEGEMAVPWQVLPLGRQYRMKHISFASAHPSGQPNNDIVHGYYLYREGNEQGPTLFYLHGWMAYSMALWLRPPLGWAEPLGLNVFFLEQPYHMRRCPPGTQSGQLSLNGDLLMGMVTIQQSVSDVRSALYWLQQKQGVKQVGLLGRSMGGLVAATTLAAEPGFDCAILDIPAVSPHSAIWRSSYTRLVRAELEQQGFDEEETAEFFEVVRPGRFRPAIDPERILLIEATADRACFPDETERFAQEWGVNLVRVPFGHMSIMFSRQAKRSAMSFLQKWLDISNQ